MTSLPLVSDIFYEQKWVPTGKNRWFGCYGIVFVHLNDFEMVDVFFCDLTYVFPFWQGRLVNLKVSRNDIYDQHNNMKRSGCDDKTWTDESSVCKACFLLACCTDSGILPLFTLNNYKYVIVCVYCVFVHCPPDVFSKHDISIPEPSTTSISMER